MELDDEANTEQDETLTMPGTSTHDTLTYDPTQGSGTEGWQRAVARQAEHNERLAGRR